MKLLTHIAAILAAATITSTSVVKTPSINNAEGNFELLILHNNDMHARFEQTSQLSGICTTADREAGKCYGGFPRVAHVVKEARLAAASGQGPPVLYLNAGDTYTGTAWFTIYKWKIAAEFINALRPDAVSLGNNELENGSCQLSPFLENLETKILASNVIVKGQEDKLQKSIIFDIQGTKVGLVGYLTPDSNILDSAGNIEYINEVIALKEEVATLQAQNVNVIIALGHANIEKDMEIAREVEGLDLVIAGHKNIFTWTGASAEDHTEKVIEVSQKSGKRVPVVQSYAYNNVLGRFHAKFDVFGEVVQYNANPVHLDDTIPQDSEAVVKVNNLRAEISGKSDEIIGKTAVVLEGDSCKAEECNLGNLIVDAINYYYAVRFYAGERWTDAPVTIIPGGHIAASIAPNNRPADITFGDLLTAIPTESHLVTVSMTGTILEQVLEHSVSTYSAAYPTGQFLQFSGVRVVYDLARESGSRLVSAVVRCWACFVPEYYAIDSWRTYDVIMPASMANGEYGYSMLEGLPRTDLTYDEVTCAAEFIGVRSPVYPDVAGRIQFLNYDPEPDNVVGPEPDTDVDPEPETEVDPEPETEVDPEPEIDVDEPDSAIAISSTLTILLLTIIPLNM